MRSLVVAGMVLGACYSPRLEGTCTVRCDQGACPDGLLCFDGVCKRSANELCGGTDGDGGIDATFVDTFVDPDTGRLCYGRGGPAPFLQICPPGVSDIERVLASGFSTDANCDLERSQVDGPDICVLLAYRFTVSGVVRVTGTRPLLLLATDKIRIAPGARLEVHASAADDLAQPPPPGLTGTCTGTDGQPSSVMSAEGGGGGGGGAFAASGGTGGSGEQTNNAGGVSNPAEPMPTLLRAGCNGGFGGSGESTVRLAGRGGGAVYLMAGGTIVIEGAINASGAGGHAGGMRGGGGGGGSGGMIVLDSAQLVDVEADAKIYALGGGGGAGGTAVMFGQSGGDPTDTTTGAGADGPGGDGGDAAQSSGGPGANGPPGGGGGGGGGGAGHIYVWPPNPAAISSFRPPPQSP